MIIYSETKCKHASVFKKTILSNDGEVMSEREVVCPLYYVERDGFTYIILYNDQMQVIHDSFEYLNYHLHAYP